MLRYFLRCQIRPVFSDPKSREQNPTKDSASEYLVLQRYSVQGNISLSRFLNWISTLQIEYRPRECVWVGDFFLVHAFNLEWSERPGQLKEQKYFFPVELSSSMLSLSLKVYGIAWIFADNKLKLIIFSSISDSQAHDLLRSYTR